MNKIVITGATGFVGSNLVKYMLKKGFKISIIIRKNSDLSNLKGICNEIEIFKYSNDIITLSNFFKAYKPNAVFHLASNFIAEHKTDQVDSLIESNINYGLHLLEAMKIAGVKNLINTGSSWQHYNNEDYNPVCLYAATKQAFESLIEYYIQAEGLKVVTLKLFDTYGETDTRPKLINLLNKFADEQTELNMSPGLQILNLVHVKDVCKAYFTAYNNLIKDNEYKGHQIYAIRNEESYSLKQVIVLFEELTGKKVKVNWGGRPYRKREVMKLWINGKELPNWTPDISLEEGLKKYK